MAAGMRVNRAPPTAASAGWNVTARAWRTTRAPILMRRVRRPVGDRSAVPSGRSMPCRKTPGLQADA